MRQGKHGVKVRCRQKLSASGLKPPHLGDGLTVGTMPIAAGVVSLSLKTTLSTVFEMASQTSRATSHQVIEYALLKGRHRVGLGIAWSKAAQDVSDFKMGIGFARGFRRVSLAGFWQEHGLTPRALGDWPSRNKNRVDS